VIQVGRRLLEIPNDHKKPPTEEREPSTNATNEDAVGSF
jgi:hypothetical protein